MGGDDQVTRTVRLGNEQIHLLGLVPSPGDRLTAEFVIPAARHAREPLLAADLRQGLVVLSTLPNIQKHACLAQIVGLEEQSHERMPGLRIVHVSADHEEHWQEVDRFHPDVRAAGYSLCCAEAESREAFVRAFGVGVEDHHRIAHGLFALQDGRFLEAEVPDDQMRPADVQGFLERLAERVGAPPDRTPHSRDGR
jgi:peroxiredoxin